jgi:hypothetical protein
MVLSLKSQLPAYKKDNKVMSQLFILPITCIKLILL